jgi:branched-chain amino acid transport system permease protein
MDMLLQILITGFVIGSCYSVVSVGMTILFQTTTVLNFGHGECVMIGAFIFYTFQFTLGASLPVAIVLTMISCIIIGALMDRAVFRPIVFAPHVNVVLATCGFLYIYRGLARLIWKSKPRFPAPLIDIQPMDLGGVIITSQDIAILVSVFLLASFFIWIFLFTETGLKMRAAAQSLRGAALVGINTDNFFTGIWGVSVGAGAIAGFLLAPIYSIHPDMGESFLLRAFAAMTLGGFGNIGGAAIGGIIMGIIENLVGLYVWTPLKEVASYLVIVAVLVFKPTGILGVRKF